MVLHPKVIKIKQNYNQKRLQRTPLNITNFMDSTSSTRPSWSCKAFHFSTVIGFPLGKFFRSGKFVKCVTTSYSSCNCVVVVFSSSWMLRFRNSFTSSSISRCSRLRTTLINKQEEMRYILVKLERNQSIFSFASLKRY